MKNFMDEDFLLQSNTAKLLYNNYAKKMPIIDYHCHINPREIAENKKYDNITQVWLYGDHYKWRAMRSCGIDERLITGDASDYEKFEAYAQIMPLLIGNPLYHWTHLELKRYFDVNITLDKDTSRSIYDKCNEMLQNGSGMSARSIINQSKVEVICTTDDPDDNLEFHKQIALDNSFKCKVLPTFRPDRLLKTSQEMQSAELITYLEKRLDYFVENGCKLADHGFESFAANMPLLLNTARLYKSRNVTMQLHFGALRNVNYNMFSKIGADTGFDCIGDDNNAKGLAKFLDELDKTGDLPNTIVYSLNPNDNAAIDSIVGAFSNVRHGAAWWFNDTKSGMEKHISDLGNVSPLGNFLGMLTDSRSFLSYTRHEYFRRILCNYIGDMIENGEYPNDEKYLKQIIENICYFNAKNFINL